MVIMFRPGLNEWSSTDPLIKTIQARDIPRGFSLNATIKDTTLAGLFQWLAEWLNTHDGWSQVPTLPFFKGTKHRVLWKNKEENIVNFSARGIWHNVRPKENNVHIILLIIILMELPNMMMPQIQFPK